MTDADDLLASIADASQASRGTPTPAAGRASNIIGQVSKQLAKEAAAARPPVAAVTSIEVLLGLDENAWRTFLDKAPTDALVACLVDASEAFRSRVVGALDDESRIWIKQNLKLLTDVTPALRDHAREEVLAAANRMIANGVIPQPGQRKPRADEPAEPPAATSAAQMPRVDVGFGGFSPTPAKGSPIIADEPVRRPVDRSTDDIAPLASSQGIGLGAEMTFSRQPGDPTIALVAEVVKVAKGKSPADLAALAGHLDQPLLVEGLRLVAQGINPNDLATALHAAQAELLAEYSRQLDVMREGVLTIRFGEGVDEFRRRAER
jgi:FliG C-terminal domain